MNECQPLGCPELFIWHEKANRFGAKLSIEIQHIYRFCLLGLVSPLTVDHVVFGGEFVHFAAHDFTAATAHLEPVSGELLTR